MNLRPAFYVLVCVLVSVRAPQASHAALNFAGEASRIYTVQPLRHAFDHDVQLGIGTLPLDAFYAGVSVHGGYTYHFNGLWAWEVARASYSWPVSTGLLDSFPTFGASVTDQQLNFSRLLLTSHAVVTPLAGKVALWQRAPFDVMTHLFFGPGLIVNQAFGTAINTASTTRFLPALGIGVGFDMFASRAIALRLQGHDLMGFDGGGVTHVLQIALAVVARFGASAAEAP